MQIRLLFYLTAICSISMATVQIPVSGTQTDFVLANQSPLSLYGLLQSGDLYLEEIDTDDDIFTLINFQGYHQSKIIGSPELPEIHKLIEVPQDAVPHVEVISEEIKYYDLSDYGINSFIYPHQPSLSKSQNPEDIPFEWNEALYQTDAYISPQLISKTHLFF